MNARIQRNLFLILTLLLIPYTAHAQAMRFPAAGGGGGSGCSTGGCSMTGDIVFDVATGVCFDGDAQQCILGDGTGGYVFQDDLAGTLMTLNASSSTLGFVNGQATGDLDVDGNFAADATVTLGNAIGDATTVSGTLAVNSTSTMSGTLTFSGVTTDVTAASGEDLRLQGGATSGSVQIMSLDDLTDLLDSGGDAVAQLSFSAASNTMMLQGNSSTAGALKVGAATGPAIIGRRGDASATSVALGIQDTITTTSGTNLWQVLGSGLVVESAVAATCADSGTGAAGALTLDITGSFIQITNNDANGCVVTVSEASALGGGHAELVVISNAGGTIDFATQAGILLMTAPYGMVVNDSLSLRYAGTLSAWVETSRGKALPISGGTLTGGITFSAVTTDITSGTNESVTIDPNGTGDLLVAGEASIDAGSNATVGALTLTNSTAVVPILIIKDNATTVFEFIDGGDLSSVTTGGAYLRTAAGSAGSPAVSFAGNNDNGLFLVALGDEIGVSTAGVQRISIDATDIVTTVPAIIDNSAASASILTLRDNGTAVITAEDGGNLGLGSTITDPKATLEVGGTFGQIMQTRSSNGTDIKTWDQFLGATGTLTFRALDDANTGGSAWLTVTRGAAGATGRDITSVAIGAGTFGGTIATKLTVDVAKVTAAVPVVSTVQTITCSAGAGVAAATLDVTSNYVQIVNNDADGCDVTLSEASAIAGLDVVIAIVTNAGTTVNFADTAGVTNLAGAFAANIDDTLSLTYSATASAWNETSRSAN